MRLDEINRALNDSAMLAEAIIGKDLHKLFGLLASSGVEFVLVGGHAISPYTGKPRTTKDVDIVSANPEEIVQLISSSFDEIEVNDVGVAIRIKKDGEEFLDIIKPEGGNVFYRNALSNSTTATILANQVKIPTLEMMIASKFAAMVSPYRDRADKMQDMTDLMRMVKRNEVDKEKLAELANDVYPGGANEIMQIVQDILDDKPLSF